MKFIIHIIVVALAAWLLQIFLPWWTMAIGAFVVGLGFQQGGWKSFLAGFLGVGILWLGMAWYLDSSTHSILTEKVAGIFPTKTVTILMIVTAVIGGLVGGFASMTGGIITEQKKRSRYR